MDLNEELMQQAEMLGEEARELEGQIDCLSSLMVWIMALFTAAVLSYLFGTWFLVFSVFFLLWLFIQQFRRPQ